MKFTTLFAFALSLIAGIAPSAASFESDPSQVNARDLVDDPFIDARDYNIFERNFDFEDDVFEREDLNLWDRSPENDNEALYARSGPTEAYKKLIALNPGMAVGKSYAFELTYPLTGKEKEVPAKETAEQKRLREMQVKLGYSHKALLVGTVTAGKDFVGSVYHMTIESKFTWHTASKSYDWKADGRAALHSKGEVNSAWKKDTIIKAGNDLNHKEERAGKYGFEQWHCGIFALELFSTLTRAPK